MASFYAIRWPVGGYGTTSADVAENNTLRQPEFHGRAPWYAEQTDGGNSLSIVATQATMNQEVAFANSMNLTGWAFLRYINVDPALGEGAVTMFKAVPSKGALKFVSMEQAGTLGTLANYTTLGARLITEMGLPYYGKVTIDSVPRPLLLWFHEPADVSRVGTLANIKTQLDWVRAQAVSAGHGDPYIVVLYWDPAVAHSVKETLAADAISSYVPLRPYTLNGSYNDVRDAAVAHWNNQRATTSPILPTMVTGWSPLPRLQRPVPWETSYQKSFVGHTNGFAFPTDIQLGAFINQTKAYMETYAEACEAETALIYAWDEFGEAGRVLCPSRENPVGSWIDNVAFAIEGSIS